MRPERIDQVVPSFGGRDAIGTHILHLRDLLRDLGFESDVWCKGAFPETRSHRQVHRRSSRSAGSARALGGSTTCRAARRWPSSSPSAPSRRWSTTTTSPRRACSGAGCRGRPRRLTAGLRQLKILAGASCFGFADSAFNEATCTTPGCQPTARSWSRRFSTRLPSDRVLDRDLAAARAREQAAGRCRLALRRPGHAEQGPARPDQGARVLPTGLRPECATSSGRNLDGRRLSACTGALCAPDSGWATPCG